MSKKALFVGLITIDLVYLTAGMPHDNQKIVASDYMVTAGGPATNAAIAFAYLSGKNYIAHLLGVVGQHPIAQLIGADLAQQQVMLTDLDPNRLDSPPVSSIIVTEATGARAVISINATKSQVDSEQISPDILDGVELILIDGHQMAAGEKIAQKAKAQLSNLKPIPVVIDGGSWKPGFEQILPFVDYAICSANFLPPTCQTQEDVFTYLSEIGIPHIAITHGEKPIEYLSQGQRGHLPVPQVKPVDTLAAGDIFHGAFCHYILQQEFIDALESAAKIASDACQFFGSRQWMKE
jgi:sugar/nucleoside kinase (ribokinase family)